MAQFCNWPYSKGMIVMNLELGYTNKTTSSTCCQAFQEEHFKSFDAAQHVFRPVQYLGSKLRTLNALIDATNHLYSKGERVFDIFSGSSVVSQAFAHNGAQVTSVDAQVFCQHLAGAMLGSCRESGECAHSVAKQIASEWAQTELPKELSLMLEMEVRAISAGPGSQLADFYSNVPQVWRGKNQEWYAPASQYIGQSGFNKVPIMASHYAGTYFGLHQALFFDFVRSRINSLLNQHEINQWTCYALLASLYSTMSKSVYSAGKHFAQPLAKVNKQNFQFHYSRMYSDRSLNVVDVFIDAANKIDTSSVSIGAGNLAIAQPVENTYEIIMRAKPSLIYADPPYTAQQYSRFYHVLETAATYTIPRLQLVNGKVTAGLYGDARYKSRYSSKTQAPKAFEELVEVSRKSGASLALSYSCSSINSDGNQRMISLPDLTKICARHFGKSNVNIIEMGHSYRQFNSASVNNLNRDDPEILLICEA